MFTKIQFKLFLLKYNLLFIGKVFSYLLQKKKIVFTFSLRQKHFHQPTYFKKLNNSLLLLKIQLIFGLLTTAAQSENQKH